MRGQTSSMTKRTKEPVGNLLLVEDPAGNGAPVEKERELSRTAAAWVDAEFGKRYQTVDLMSVTATLITYAVGIWKQQHSIAGTRGDVALRQLGVLAKHLYRSAPSEPTKTIQASL